MTTYKLIIRYLLVIVSIFTILIVVFFNLSELRTMHPLTTSQKYAKIFSDWKSFLRKNRIENQSLAIPYINNSYFNEFVIMGDDAIPYLINDIENGEPYLTYALDRITMIDMHARYRALHPEMLGLTEENEVEKMWIKWWKDRLNLTTTPENKLD